MAVDPLAGRLPGGMDPDPAGWVRQLTASGAEREAALARLHDLLLRVARSELRRRSGQLRIAGPELDDLAYQAAADALLAITRKLSEFRAESRFTTWACKFVIIEVSSKAGRHFWRSSGVSLDEAGWDRLPDRFGVDPAAAAESEDLVVALRQAVDEQLTSRQREVFTALVLRGIPLDALAAELGTSRNALYKTMFDARRKLRAALVANGYLDSGPPRHP